MSAGPRRLTSAGGRFRDRHRALVGPDVDLGELSPEKVPVALLPRVRAVWQERVRSELRSVQIMARFLTEVAGAGDPIEVYSIAADLVTDEVRHAELCAAVCGRLGAPALLPEPVELVDADAFLRSPMPERALATAISMLAINETISNALVADLLDRCDHEPIRRVLAATTEDEAEHGDFGWDYVTASLARFDPPSMPHWRALVARVLEPHQAFLAAVKAGEGESGRPEDERDLARFGLFSPGREAMVVGRTIDEVLAPRLRELGLTD